VPAGHKVHEAAPASEYDPARQSLQAPTLVALGSGWYVPAAQLVHEADVLALHVPSIHAMQLLADDCPVRELADPAEQLLQIGEPAFEY
jgi:hypothetical protein